MPLYTAVSMGHLGAARCLVTALGADVNQESSTDYRLTPLIAAVKARDIDMIRCLINDLGADVNKGDRGNRTPLHYAVSEGDLNLATCLVKEFGADVNPGDEEGFTPLHLAVFQRDIKMMRCLVFDLGANVNQTIEDGSPPLCVAAGTGYFDGVRCFVRELGADINHKESDGYTPLLFAAQRKHAAIAKWLVKAGADPQARHRLQGTAADISRAVGASPEQTAYLGAKAHCANPGCSGAGTKKCQGCMQGRYCGRACHLAHWPNHRAECRRLGAALKSAQQRRVRAMGAVIKADQDFLERWGFANYLGMRKAHDIFLKEKEVRLTDSEMAIGFTTYLGLCSRHLAEIQDLQK
jgi:ankyrin repeat protein